jgi:hypothetical protein
MRRESRSASMTVAMCVPGDYRRTASRSSRRSPAASAAAERRGGSARSRPACGTLAWTAPSWSHVVLLKAEAGAVEDMLDVAVGIDDDGHLIPAASIGQRQ